MADKLEKSRLIRGVKILEVLIMLAAAFAFWLDSVTVLIALLFLMGTQSTLFGPVKYSILPQHLREEELVGGNALVETGTFLAILLGTMLGGILIAIDDGGNLLVAVTLVLVALLGYAASLGVPKTPAAEPDLKINWNPITETWDNLTSLRGNRTVFLSVLGVSWFWYFGATYLAQLPNYTKEILGGGEGVVTLLLTLFSVGVGAGSLLCEKLSGHKVELGLVPFGAIGLSLFSIDLYFARPEIVSGELLGAFAFLAQPGAWRIVLDIVLVGTFGGFYIVPLYALIQNRSEPSRRSRVIAGNNILNALLMVMSAIVAIVVLSSGFSIPQLFLLTALLNVVVAAYIFTLVPEFLMRFIVWMLIHLMYRIDKKGLEAIPDEGPAVLVCNHVSFVDALVIAGCCRRPVRFVMDHQIFSIPVLSFVFRTAKAIPIASYRHDPDTLKQAYDDISAALENGNLVCVFPEGRITRDGEMNEFRPGVEKIVARNPVPVIPMALSGLWGSFFSRRYGDAMMAVPRRFWSRIGFYVGASVPPADVEMDDLQQRVSTLRGAKR
jgi:1-acyl-sn-glycerol-3-phosphate acyltransferase